MIERIVSGGQTGVDRAALDFALTHGIDCGGWCPKGRRAEDGKIPACYPLTECNDKRYKVRTEKNVLDSDATLIFKLGPLSAGTALTARLAEKHHRPLYVFDLGESHRLDAVLSWMSAHAVVTLNIAGPRESQRPGVGSRAYVLLKKLLADSTR